jgi:uncharacterized protein with PIN domain
MSKVEFRAPLVRISHMNAPAASQSPSIYPAAHKVDSILYTDVYPRFFKTQSECKKCNGLLKNVYRHFQNLVKVKLKMKSEAWIGRQCMFLADTSP